MVSQLGLKIAALLKLERTLSTEQLAETLYQAIVALNITYQRKTSGTRRLFTRVVEQTLGIGLMLPRVMI
jgi:hypothetical protein